MIGVYTKFSTYPHKSLFRSRRQKPNLCQQVRRITLTTCAESRLTALTRSTVEGWTVLWDTLYIKNMSSIHGTTVTSTFLVFVENLTAICKGSRNDCETHQRLVSSRLG